MKKQRIAAKAAADEFMAKRRAEQARAERMLEHASKDTPSIEELVAQIEAMKTEVR